MEVKVLYWIKIKLWLLVGNKLRSIYLLLGFNISCFFSGFDNEEEILYDLIGVQWLNM